MRPPTEARCCYTPFAAVTIYPFAYRSLDYDPFTDLAPLTQVCTFDFALAVRSEFPAKTPQELVAWLKANPASAQYGSPGAGALPHFFGLLFGRAAGVEMTHIAYKGTAPALSDLLGGQIPMVSSTVSDFLELHRAGKHSRHRDLGRRTHDGPAGCADVQGKRHRYCWKRLVRDVCSRPHTTRCRRAPQCGPRCSPRAAGPESAHQRLRSQADRNIAGATRRNSESRCGQMGSDREGVRLYCGLKISSKRRARLAGCERHAGGVHAVNSLQARRAMLGHGGMDASMLDERGRARADLCGFVRCHLLGTCATRAISYFRCERRR